MPFHKLQVEHALRKLKKSAEPVRSRSTAGPGNQAMLSSLVGTHIGSEQSQSSLGESQTSAFDSLSGQTLTPMSQAAGGLSTQAPVQAKKKKETPEPQVDTSDPDALVRMAVEHEQHKLVADDAVHWGLMPKGMEYDYDGEHGRLRNALSAMDPATTEAFNEKVVGAHIMTLSQMDLNSPMDRYNDEYYNALAVRNVSRAYHSPDRATHARHASKYMSMNDYNDPTMDNVFNGNARLVNAGTGRDAYGNFVGKLQSDSTSKSNIRKQIKQLKKLGLLRKRRG